MEIRRISWERKQRMKLGGFGKIEDYDAIREAGFDYAELDMPEIEALDEAALEHFAAHVQETDFPVPTGARVLPYTEPMFFLPGFHALQLQPYLQSTCRKNARIGVKKILLGNGKARWLIDETSGEREQQFFDFMKLLCETAGENGQEVLIEPLGPKYSNYLNTVPEALEAVDRIGMPNLSVMADIRHFVWAGEPFTDISAYHERIGHYHIDFPLSWPERRYPSAEDGYNYGAFLQQLRAVDQGDLTLTVEADIPKDWKKAGEQVRTLLAKY